VSQPLPKGKKYEAPKHEAPKYEAPKHEAPKKTITTYRPHVEKKKPRKKPPGRKKVIEICAKNKTSFFALFLFVGRKSREDTQICQLKMKYCNINLPDYMPLYLMIYISQLPTESIE